MNDPPDPRSSMWAWMAYMLRFLRLQQGMSGTVVAEMLNVARSQISRLENGESKLNTRQAATLDKELNTGELFSIMLFYAARASQPNWRQQFEEFEARARRMHYFAGQLVPALLQTPGYARALLIAGRWPDVEGAVERRMARKEVINSPDPADLWILLAESVLDWPVGGAEVMRGQLDELLRVTELPHVTLRVVPRSVGAYDGLDGPFKLVTVREGLVGFLEAPIWGRLVIDVAETEALRLRFDRIAAHALPIGASQRLILQYREAME